MTGSEKLFTISDKSLFQALFVTSEVRETLCFSKHPWHASFLKRRLAP
jgi:hypothetical protein